MIRRALACFALLAGVTLVPAPVPAQQGEPQDSLGISFHGKAWALEIRSPGFVIETQETKPDGREYLFAENPRTKVLISVTLEQAKAGADRKTCPDYLRKRMDLMSQFNPMEIEYSEISHMAVVEYMISKPPGAPLGQKNIVACAAKEDVYADIHLSKVRFQPSDESLFTDVLKQIRFADHAATVATAKTPPVDAPSAGAAPAARPGATSLEYFKEGSRRFISQDYRGAIAPYEAALDMEKKLPRLSTNYWRVLVDNLAMAYGISGDLDHSEQTYDYGLSKDPTYPGFYYGMACVWAERNNMDKAMENLQKAFSFKANVIPSETVPDPRQDDSFQRFMENERFRKFVNSLYSSE